MPERAWKLSGGGASRAIFKAGRSSAREKETSWSTVGPVRQRHWWKRARTFAPLNVKQQKSPSCERTPIAKGCQARLVGLYGRHSRGRLHQGQPCDALDTGARRLLRSIRTHGPVLGSCRPSFIPEACVPAVLPAESPCFEPPHGCFADYGGIRPAIYKTWTPCTSTTLPVHQSLPFFYFTLVQTPT